MVLSANVRVHNGMSAYIIGVSAYITTCPRIILTRALTVYYLAPPRGGARVGLRGAMAPLKKFQGGHISPPEKVSGGPPWPPWVAYQGGPWFSPHPHPYPRCRHQPGFSSPNSEHYGAGMDTNHSTIEQSLLAKSCSSVFVISWLPLGAFKINVHRHFDSSKSRKNVHKKSTFQLGSSN